MRHRGLLAFTCLSFAAGCSAAPGSEEPKADTSTPGTPDERALTNLELLGKRLFEDATLSEPPGQACASCHDPQQGFQGNAGSRIAAVALGSRPETFGTRNVPTVSYATYSPPFAFVSDDGETVAKGGQFWDGRAATLADQAKGPFLNPREMNNPSAAAVVDKVARGPYAELFAEVLGEDALGYGERAYDRFAEAIAAYEGTERFHPFRSKFDDVLRGTASFDDHEAHGFSLFKDPEKGNCIACHAGDVSSTKPADWLFTDFTYDTLGVPRNTKIPDDADPSFYDLGLCKQPGLDGLAPAEFDVSSVCGAFKVPTLRNIELTAPYMHNGFFTELRDVVRFYVTRDTNPELWYPQNDDGTVRAFDDLPQRYRGNVNHEEVPYDRKLGEAPRLTDDEIDDVVAFLRTLTDR